MNLLTSRRVGHGRVAILVRTAHAHCVVATHALIRILSMRLYMLLEVLRALERLSAELAFVGLQRYVHTNVRGNVVTFDSSRIAVTPTADEVEIVCRFTPNMLLADMILSC